MAASPRLQPPAPPSLGLADALAGLVVVASALALHTYCVIDTRPASDLGHYYRPLPQLHAVLVHGGDPLALLGAVAQPGGAYNLLLAGIFALFGLGEHLFDRVEMAWLTLLLVGGWGTARALAGPGAGLAATMLLAMVPVFQVGARTHWLHFVEAAAVVGALWAWTTDPALARWRTRVALALATAFCISLRPTGLLYMGSLLAVATWSVPDRRRVALPAVGLVAGLFVLLPTMDSYVGGKVAVREVYQATVRPLVPSLAEQTFMLPGLLLLLGAALAPLLRRRAILAAPDLLLLAWVAGGLGLGALFRVGIDNFPLVFFAAAVLAAQGLSALPGRPALAVGGLALTGLVLAAPFLPPERARALVPALGPAVVSFESFHYLRPQSRGLGVADLQPMLDQACGEHDGVCTLLATSGLFNLNREDDASLAFFLAGVRGVKVLNGGQWWTPEDLTADDAIEALVVMDCQQLGRVLTPFLERELAVGALARAIEARKVGEVGPPAPCPQTWYVLDHPDSRVPILAWAKAHDWQAHILPEILPPLRPRRQGP